MKVKNFVRANAARAVAIVLILVLYVAARNPEITEADRRALASSLHFTRSILPAFFKDEPMPIRDLRPDIHHISGWAATGASIAFADLDGDGIANDLCQTDARYHYAVVRMAPGTESRAHPYEPIVLDPRPL